MSTVTQKTALAYLRISDKKQIDGESENNQRKVIKAYAEANGIKIIEWFYDEAKSGKNTDRAELQNMLKVATKYKGKIDYVIVYKMNRASRDLNSYIIGMRSILKAKGISIRSATEPIDDSPMGNFMENLYVMVGQLDNENKKEVVVDNMRSLALQGYWQHGPVICFDSLTIKNSDGKDRPSLQPNAMGVIGTKVLLRFQRGDMSIADLTRWAKQEGFRSVNDSPLDQEQITRFLKRPENAGYVHDKYTNYEIVKGQHKGIIEPETYWHIQNLIARKSNMTLLGLEHKTTNPTYPLRKFLICPHCQTILTSSAPSGSPRYFCRNCKGVPSMMTKIVHAKFVDYLKSIQPTERTLKLYKEILLRQSLKELGNLDKDIAELRRKLDTLSEERTKTLRKYAMDKLGEPEKDEIINTIDSEKLGITDSLAKLEEQQTLKEVNIEYALNFMGNVAKIWNDAPLDLKIKFQNLIFPKGLELDTREAKFRSPKISALYRYVPAENESISTQNSLMVIPRGIEPLLSG